MNIEILHAWDKYKGNLEAWFKEYHPESYSDIVTQLFELVINNIVVFDVSKMTVIDHGDCQGTQVFIIPKNTYPPSVGDYIYTHDSYGSCSGCDTLLRIQEGRSYIPGQDKPTEQQVSDYMTLALHLVQKCRYLGD